MIEWVGEVGKPTKAPQVRPCLHCWTLSNYATQTRAPRKRKAATQKSKKCIQPLYLLPRNADNSVYRARRKKRKSEASEEDEDEASAGDENEDEDEEENEAPPPQTDDEVLSDGSAADDAERLGRGARTLNVRSRTTSKEPC